MTEARWDSHEQLIAALRAVVDKHAQPAASTLAKLPKPTSRENVKGKCDVCGGWHGLPAVHLDYMGHAEVTLALIDADPLWEWDAVRDEHGLPIVDKQGNRYVMWGSVTVCGVTRPCVGTCDAGKPEPEKELIGDLLRNGAMRFGIGTKLWSKATDADAAGSGGAGGYDSPRTAKASTPLSPGKVVINRMGDATPDTKAKIAALTKEDPFKGRKMSHADLDAYPEWLDAVVEVLDAASG